METDTVSRFTNGSGMALYNKVPQETRQGCNLFTSLIQQWMPAEYKVNEAWKEVRLPHFKEPQTVPYLSLS